MEKQLSGKQFRSILIIKSDFLNYYKKSNKSSHKIFNTLKLFIMPLLTILLVLIVVGVLLWLINNYIPMDSKIKNILNVVVVIIVILWLLKAFGLLDSIKGIRI